MRRVVPLLLIGGLLSSCGWTQTVDMYDKSLEPHVDEAYRASIARWCTAVPIDVTERQLAAGVITAQTLYDTCPVWKRLTVYFRPVIQPPPPDPTIIIRPE